MGNFTALIATAKVNPGSEEAFASWQGRHLAAISDAAGFISTDMIPPAPDKAGGMWTLITNFESNAAAVAWQQSPERNAIHSEALPLLIGSAFNESMNADSGAPGKDVTEVIFSRIKHGMEDRYREWAVRIQAAQAKYPGYRGMYLQPAKGREGYWISILRYDTAEHLDAWMNAPERKVLLAESQEFIQSEELMRLGTAFPGWMPIDPVTGESPPDWKAAMLVLLGLFPIVMLEMKYLSPVLSNLGIKASLGTFIGNVISVGLTSFLTMPFFVRWFGWWLLPKGNKSAATTKGSAILCVLFVIEVIALWRLLPW